MLTKPFLNKLIAWSVDTFGPGRNTESILKHIEKELDEIRSDPTDLEEWADVLILAFDGAWRQGYTPQEIFQAWEDKIEKNMKRKWPDWRSVPKDQPIEHIR